MLRPRLDLPCLYITEVTNRRLAVFQRDYTKDLVCLALSEARLSGGFALLAYVLMPDHLHLLTDAVIPPSEILRRTKGVTARRVIDFLKDHNFTRSLEKLRHREGPRDYRYSLWEHHSNAKPVLGESVLLQKVRYIHQNPVRAGLVARPEDYRWPSARCWKGCPAPEEPLLMDLDRLGIHPARPSLAEN
ncbi:MAG TPA: transposase [Acidobacteriota bacterium]|jgi:REP element-mobilizing transposase RayT